MKKQIFILGLITASLISCGKYEEGPSLALSSKKSRLAGHWTLTSRTMSGQSTILQGYSEQLHIDKDGSFKDTAYQNFQGFNYSAPVEGTWRFSEDKMQLILTSNTSASSSNFSSGDNNFDIIKLSKDEIKLKRSSGSSIIISTYTAQ